MAEEFVSPKGRILVLIPALGVVLALFTLLPFGLKPGIREFVYGLAAFFVALTAQTPIQLLFVRGQLSEIR